MNFKKTTALGMAAVMTMSLAACGSNETENTNTEAKTATDAVADTTVDTASDTAEASGVPTYGEITLGEDYTDLTATIKFMHHKTDREQDGTMDRLVAEFNEVYPNIVRAEKSA